MAVIDSYSGRNGSSLGLSAGPSGSSIFKGVTITGNGQKIGSAAIYVSRNAGIDTSGNLYLLIFPSSGTPGTNAVGVGTTGLAQSDLTAVTSLPTTTGRVAFTFSGANQITLTAGTVYVIGVKGDGTGSSSSGMFMQTGNSAVNRNGTTYNSGWTFSLANTPVIEVYDTNPTGGLIA